jgi:hypothetical protein
MRVCNPIYSCLTSCFISRFQWLWYYAYSYMVKKRIKIISHFKYGGTTASELHADTENVHLYTSILMRTCL